MIILAITEIREDLIGLCEDNEVMIKAINDYFDDYEKRLCPQSEEEKSDIATLKPSDLHRENKDNVV